MNLLAPPPWLRLGAYAAIAVGLVWLGWGFGAGHVQGAWDRDKLAQSSVVNQQLADALKAAQDQAAINSDLEAKNAKLIQDNGAADAHLTDLMRRYAALHAHPVQGSTPASGEPPSGSQEPTGNCGLDELVSRTEPVLSACRFDGTQETLILEWAKRQGLMK